MNRSAAVLPPSFMVFAKVPSPAEFTPRQYEGLGSCRNHGRSTLLGPNFGWHEAAVYV